MNTSSFLSCFPLYASCAFAAPLIQDDFDRSGSLAGSSPEAGSVWTGDALPVDGSVFLGVQNGEAVTRFASVRQATLYAGFDLTINNISALQGRFPFALMDDDSMIARVFLRSADANQSYRLGIENNLDNAIFWPESFPVGTTLRVVVGLTENGSLDETRMWINPVSLDSPYVSDAIQPFLTKVNGVVIRSTTSGFQGAGALDDLYVGSDFATAIPEPSAAGLLCASMALASLTWRRPRRHA